MGERKGSRVTRGIPDVLAELGQSLRCERGQMLTFSCSERGRLVIMRINRSFLTIPTSSHVLSRASFVGLCHGTADRPVGLGLRSLPDVGLCRLHPRDGRSPCPHRLLCCFPLLSRVAWRGTLGHHQLPDPGSRGGVRRAANVATAQQFCSQSPRFTFFLYVLSCMSFP